MYFFPKVQASVSLYEYEYVLFVFIVLVLTTTKLRMYASIALFLRVRLEFVYNLFANRLRFSPDSCESMSQRGIAFSVLVEKISIVQ
jgi:hypothetical protein